MILPERFKNYKVNIKKELEHRFLYENDLSSIYYLIHLVESERQGTLQKPKYISVKRIKNALRMYLQDRDDRDLICSTIGKMILEPVNKIELAMYIEAYSLGYDQKTMANELETYALRMVPPKFLCRRKKLFHDVKFVKIKRIKKDMIHRVIAENQYLAKNKVLLMKYCEQTFKDHLMSLNKYLNKQLTFVFDGNTTAVTEEKFLTQDELSDLYQKTVNTFISSMNSIAKEAIWYGLNDRVLSRYNG